MTSQRALAGGGREMTLSTSYSIPGSTGTGSNWFGPGAPITPVAPTEVKGRAFDFPTAFNTFNAVRGHEPVTHATLRAFADGYDLLRLIIETRKDAMERLRWVIQPRDSKDKLTPQKRNKIKQVTKFFMKPDGEHNWNAWLRMVLEDLFVIDAVTLHRRRTRGGQLIALDQIDGATMRRVLDNHGRTPEGKDDTAYQQILHGMPAVNYRSSEILYRPRNLRVHKVYGYSPVEQLIMTINIGLRRQVFQLNFFTEGNMPPALIGVPESWTPDQIRVFQEWFDNIMTGNLAERRRARFVPAAVGKTYVPTQETELFGKAEEWLARVACFAFSVSPQPFIQMMNRSTSDTASREALSTGLAPIQNWVKSIIDDVLAEDMDCEDLEFIWKGDDELDPVKRAEISQGNLKVGFITVNEGRVDMGREPYEDKIYDQPMFLTSNGLAPLIPDEASQGKHSFDANGNPIKKPETEGKDPSERKVQPDPADIKKLDTVESLIRFGSQPLLAGYLSKFTEEHDHE